ncbi:HAD domain-containing protein [Paraburkholderia graminis]|uniref:HAD domain-containing protein n=1 Tax=Paraburkholderia graminis TaxID=60548 RepID=UPI0031E1FD0F
MEQFVFDALRPTLYLDVDGTLHSGSAIVGEAERITLEGGRDLFEHAPLLAAILAPWPDVQIVLTTSWLKHIGRDGVTSYLPEPLRYRVVGDTLGIRSRMGEVRDGTDRVSKILRHVWAHGVQNWLALDDQAWGVPIEYAYHFVHLSHVSGISSPEARSQIESWLLEQQGQ